MIEFECNKQREKKCDCIHECAYGRNVLVRGYFKGEPCHRDGCLGIIEEKDLEGGCSCHTGHPPCGYCETPKEICPDCGWDAEDEKYEDLPF